MGLRHSVGELGHSLLSIVSTRIELFSIELSEQKERLLKVLCLSFGALLCLSLALLILTLAVALVFWPTEYRYVALFGAVAVYAVAGLGMMLAVWRLLTRGAAPFEATIEELRNDVAWLERLNRQDPVDDVRRGGPDHV